MARKIYIKGADLESIAEVANLSNSRINSITHPLIGINKRIKNVFFSSTTFVKPHNDTWYPTLKAKSASNTLGQDALQGRLKLQGVEQQVAQKGMAPTFKHLAKWCGSDNQTIITYNSVNYSISSSGKNPIISNVPAGKFLTFAAAAGGGGGGGDVTFGNAQSSHGGGGGAGVCFSIWNPNNVSYNINFSNSTGGNVGGGGAGGVGGSWLWDTAPAGGSGQAMIVAISNNNSTSRTTIYTLGGGGGGAGRNGGGGTNGGGSGGGIFERKFTLTTINGIDNSYNLGNGLILIEHIGVNGCSGGTGTGSAGGNIDLSIANNLTICAKNILGISGSNFLNIKNWGSGADGGLGGGLGASLLGASNRSNGGKQTFDLLNGVMRSDSNQIPQAGGGGNWAAPRGAGSGGGYGSNSAGGAGAPGGVVVYY